MPLFDYRCDSCEADFETLVRREADVASIACPKCESKKVHRLLSLPAAPVSVGAAAGSMSTGPGGCGVGPPCGAPWCGRK
jgi:putative FmdB family regulatory protein